MLTGLLVIPGNDVSNIVRAGIPGAQFGATRCRDQVLVLSVGNNKRAETMREQRNFTGVSCPLTDIFWYEFTAKCGNW